MRPAKSGRRSLRGPGYRVGGSRHRCSPSNSPCAFYIGLRSAGAHSKRRHGRRGPRGSPSRWPGAASAPSIGRLGRLWTAARRRRRRRPPRLRALVTAGARRCRGRHGERAQSATGGCPSCSRARRTPYRRWHRDLGPGCGVTKRYEERGAPQDRRPGTTSLQWCHALAAREDPYGSPASIQATMRARSASVGLGPVPIGNCLATGEAAQFHAGSCVAATPQRIESLSFATSARTV